MTATAAGSPGAVPRKRCSPLAGSARNDTVKAPEEPRAPAKRVAPSRRSCASFGGISGGGDSASTTRSPSRSVTSISPGIQTVPLRSTRTGASIRRTPGEEGVRFMRGRILRPEMPDHRGPDPGLSTKERSVLVFVGEGLVPIRFI